MRSMNKKGVLDNLSALAVGIAGLAITMVVVFLILGQTAANTTVAGDANASASLVTLQNATSDIPGWVPLIILVAIGGLILGLVSAFGKRR